MCPKAPFSHRKLQLRFGCVSSFLFSPCPFARRFAQPIEILLAIPALCMYYPAELETGSLSVVWPSRLAGSWFRHFAPTKNLWPKHLLGLRV